MVNQNIIRVLVTGVGAVIGQGIIKSLIKKNTNSKKKLFIIGLDKKNDSVGKYLCNRFFVKPNFRETSAEYYKFWRDMIIKEKIDLVIPGIEDDLYFLNRKRKELAEITQIAINNSHIISICKDKWKTYKFFINKNIPLISTVLFEGQWSKIVNSLGKPPFLIKPRSGNGARGIQIIKNERDYEYWKYYYEKKKYIIQNYIKGTEYTAGSFGISGNLTKPIIFKRRLLGTGSTMWAEVVYNNQIEKIIELISTYLPCEGANNFQFIEKNKKIFLLEINPRISSSTSMRAKLGYNESGMVIDYFLENKKIKVPAVKRGKVMRFLEDIVV